MKLSEVSKNCNAAWAGEGAVWGTWETPVFPVQGLRLSKRSTVANVRPALI